MSHFEASVFASNGCTDNIVYEYCVTQGKCLSSNKLINGFNVHDRVFREFCNVAITQRKDKQNVTSSEDIAGDLFRSNLIPYCLS